MLNNRMERRYLTSFCCMLSNKGMSSNFANIQANLSELTFTSPKIVRKPMVFL